MGVVLNKLAEILINSDTPDVHLEVSFGFSDLVKNCDYFGKMMLKETKIIKKLTVLLGTSNSILR